MSAPPVGAEPVLAARGIVKRFGGAVALDGVSIELRPGEVHCIAGENGSGKSTLIKIISGAERPDRGEIVIDGVAHARMNATSAITSGVQVIYQDFSLFPNLSVLENIVLTRAVAGRRRLYRPSAGRPVAQAIVDELGVALDLDEEVGRLTVADKQLTAICRALVGDARVIIMDEPTTALTHTEVTRLFSIVERLRQRGVALVFVSHKLDEVLAISQRLTIMRSGRVVTSGPVNRFDRRSIAEHMTGQELNEERLVAELPTEAEAVLEVSGLTLPGAFSDVTFTVQRGEIVGLTGLLGSGRTEIAEAIFGVRPATGGRISVNGRERRIRRIQDSIAAGIGYVPEDRLTQGLFLEKPIADNITASSLGAHRTRWFTLDRGRIADTVDRLFSGLRIKADDAQAPVRSLSGGNAQRVVLAKWLATNPTVLLLNGPTVGVDIGSKAQILDLLRAEAARGTAIVIISDDLLELVACCHRVLVVAHGRLVDELAGDDVDGDVIQRSIAA